MTVRNRMTWRRPKGEPSETLPIGKSHGVRVSVAVALKECGGGMFTPTPGIMNKSSFPAFFAPDLSGAFILMRKVGIGKGIFEYKSCRL